MQLARAPTRRWKILTDCPLYEVSNDGRVRLCGARKVLPVQFSKQGRPRYSLPCCGGRFLVDAHVLVAFAFLPAPPPGKSWVLHADDDPLNCVDTNLRWGDRWDNARDYVANRRGRLGLPAPKAPLQLKGTAPAKVFAILKATGPHDAIAKNFGVSRSTVTKIRRGERHPQIFRRHQDGQAAKPTV